MAAITEFEIEGLAGRSEMYRQTLRRDINVFFGPNGSGKTTLLKILQSALSGETEILAGIPFRRARVDVYSHDYDKVFTRVFVPEQESAAESNVKLGPLLTETKRR